MRFRTGQLLTTIAFVALTFGIGAAPREDDPTIAHVLNRIGFGPGPGDIERVRRQGLRQYIDAQLYPERIDDSGAETRLAAFATLALSSRDLAERYGQPAPRGPRDNEPRAADDAARAAERRNMAQLPLAELSEQKILRAVYSERQLQEVLVDFWFNHFNVDARKGPTRFLITEYEREAIRPHVLGRFRDLLGATAQSPAMLFYLDNWMSADPDASTKAAAMRRAGAAARRMRATRPAPRPAMPRGLNENYGRELLELHTLGVDGGYTQQDVREVARALTGWSIDGPRQGGPFRFVPALHDDGKKTVLGRTIAGGGQSDGREVLDLLAAHPSTAAFISRKLAARFVSDTPPQALVDRMAVTFTKTGGDLRAVMRVLLTSPEFLTPEAAGAKVKTPFDFIVSAVRALDAEVGDAQPLVRALRELGMPLYQCQPPTGYRDTADAWINTGALVARMNVAQALAGGRLRGVNVSRVGDAVMLLGSGISGATAATIAKATTPAQAVALALGSPEFQRR